MVLRTIKTKQVWENQGSKISPLCCWYHFFSSFQTKTKYPPKKSLLEIFKPKCTYRCQILIPIMNTAMLYWFNYSVKMRNEALLSSQIL